VTASGNARFRWLAGRYAAPHVGILALLVGLTLVGNLLTVLQPAILAAMLANLAGTTQQVVPEGASWLNLNYLGTRVSQWASSQTGGAFDVLIVFGVLFVLASILVAILSYGAESTAAWLRAQIGRAIQLDLLAHLLEQDMAFFTRQKAGELISRVTFDVTGTAQAVGPLIRSVIHNVLQVAVYAAYLFNTSISLTVGAGGLILVQFGLTQALKRPTRRLAREETDSTASFLGTLQEAFTSVRVTKSFGAERFQIGKFAAAADALVATLWRKGRLEKLEAPSRSVVDSFAVLGIFLIAVMQLRAGQLTFEGLILFTYVARSLIAPINQLATSALWIESVGASSGRIHALLAERPRIVDGATIKTTFDSSLHLDQCSFSYDGRPVIDDVSLEIRKGEFIALVGPSGAGKSTLGDLLLRLYDPDSGRILIDGVDLKTLSQRHYRRMFGVVSQENLLFHDSVRNNIRYGREDITDARVMEAARLANAHDFIMALPEGYDTVVGDRGVKLSGGERQRVAIARAIVHDPQILILDEATSALDSTSERLVQQAINEVVGRTTAVVIAHRLSTVTHADRIVVLNQGRIEAVGRHQQLLETSATYRSYCELQFERSPVGANLS
jgi:subfamily B ATP-binding cassette protein MsbA